MAREATLSVSLTNQLKAYVRQKVDSGQFESASEVIRQSLRAMQAHEHEENTFWADVRKKVKQARADIAAGNEVDGPTFMRAKIAALRDRTGVGKRSAASKKRL